MRITLFLIASLFSVSLSSQTDYLISTGGTVYVDSGDKFYDAGGPAGDDGNTSYTMTLCPATPGEKVAVDFNYFVSTWDSMWDDEDRLVIYDGTSATGLDIGDLKGDYTIKYNTGVTPHGMGVEAYSGFPLIGTPTIFSATNSTGCLTFEFINGYSEQNPGWEAEILTYTPIDEPGCNIGITASDDSICTGDPVTLIANGTVSNSPINNDFNSGSIGTGWSATSSASFVNNACGYPSLDGSLYLWMQNAAGPRGLVTNVMDASMGGSISFEYRQAINNGNASPCESPDQGSGTFEGIYLQYSTDGTNWTTFKYIYPNGTEGSFGAEMGLTGCGNYVKRWTKMTYPIPVAAQSATTQFRWVQAKVTSSSTDNWGLDNVVIAIPTGSYTVSIEDLSTSTIIASQVDGDATCVVNPATTTTYRAMVDDGSSSCFEDITVYVADPFVLSCGTSTATIVGFDWTVANGATSYDYSYSVDGAPAVSGNTSANTLSVGPVASGSSVELTVTPVSSICSDPQTVTCTTTGCVTPVADAGATFVIDCNTTSANLDGSGSSTGAGYSYAWSTGDGNIVSGADTQTPLVNQAGTYTLTVTNTSGGCIDTDNVTITENTTPPTAGITNNTGTTVLDCTTTSISVTATGGGTYSWSGGSTPGTANNSLTTAGNYTVTVTGANGCTDTQSINITQNATPPTAGITNNTGTTVLDCTTTSISVTATGGGTYSWSGGATPGTANNTLTTAGNYTVTVTGTNGCTDTQSINITQNATPPTAGITNNTGTTILDCNTTSISVTATGGGTYSWSGGATPGTSGNTLNSAGNYTVTVTAANGCTDTEAINITQNITPPSAGITNNTGTTVLDCNNTSISVTATGGGTYSWSGGASPASVSNTFNTSGNYTVTVTGANGCTDTESINITQDISSPTVNITNNTVTTVLDCSTTAINVTASGGISYAWSGGSTPGMSTNTFTSPSNYVVTVTGTNGCTNTSSINITQDISSPTAGITNNTGTTDLTCIVTSISLTATGGVSYLWSGGSNTTSANNTLTSPGAYTVTVTGSNGCTDTEVINITQSVTPPVASITNNTGTTELDCNNTFISLTAGGGGTYSWSGGSSTTMANNVITSPGLYTVTVSLVNGCTDSEVINITQNITPPTAGIINTTGSDILTCNLTSIDVLATGGGTYVWSGGSSLNSANNIFNTPGNYTVTVTGTNGCTDTESVNISQNIVVPTAGITNLSGTTILTCLDNSIDLMSTGGGTYLWSGGTSPSLSTNTINSPGNYTVTVTGSNGCTDTESISITENAVYPTAGITNNTGAVVLDCNTTSISVTATGGGTYSWSGGSTPSTSNNTLSSAGTYIVTITAANGCTDTETINITQNITPPTAGISNNTGTSILDCNTASINVTATGGGTYSWSGGATPSSSNNTLISAGNYTVTVTAANGCTDTEQINITSDTNPPTASINNLTGTDVLTCTVNIINVTASGGISYLWSGGTSTSSSSNSFTSPGNYIVTVTGNNGCTATNQINISEDITAPTAIITNLTGSTSINCHNSQIQLQASGGTIYQWSGGNSPNTANNTITSGGTYTVTVESNNGCTDTESITIVESQPLSLSLNPVSATCCGSGGQITSNLTGGVGPYTYSWSNGDSSQDIFSLSPGTYTLSVTDSENCTVSDQEVITATGQINVTIDQVQTLGCNGDETGVLEAMSSNGQNPFSFTWNTGQTYQTISNLGAGDYSVTITDDWGCVGTDQTSLVNPNNMSINADVNSVSCYGDIDGSISLVVSGGNLPYDYSWSNSETSATISDLSPGDYIVTVTDDEGCTISDNYTIINPEKINLNLIVTDIECFGLSNGSIEMSANGGTEPYTFTLTDGYNNTLGSQQTGLRAGSYTAMVTDNNNCITSVDATILEPSELYLSYEVYNPSCRGNDDGYVQIQAIGGTEPYLYMWDTYILDTGMITGLEEGLYNFEVIDANNCSKELNLISLNDIEVDCINIPNAFTPNSDGINDEWLIQNIDLFPDAQINIFNRWGQMMYSGRGNSEPWDGQYNGKFVPAGTYVYTVNLYTSEKTYNGVVTVVY